MAFQSVMILEGSCYYKRTTLLILSFRLVFLATGDNFNDYESQKGREQKNLIL